MSHKIRNHYMVESRIRSWMRKVYALTNLLYARGKGMMDCGVIKIIAANRPEL